MKHYLKLSVPEPCHEQWNEMTPTEKGAFCAVCAKEVVDFSTMNTQEVKNYFLEKANTTTKTCGRFSVDQLNKPISIDQKISRKPYPLAELQKFAAAVLIVFGTMSCNVDHNSFIQGEIAEPVVNISVSPSSTEKNDVLSEEIPDVIMDYYTMGDIDWVEEDSILPPPPPKHTGCSVVEDEILTIGEVVAPPDYFETIEIESKREETLIKPEYAVGTMIVTSGMTVVEYIDDPEEVDFIEGEEKSEGAEIDLSENNNELAQSEVTTYPNPARDVVTFDLNNLSKRRATVRIYNASGQVVNTIVWNGLLKGKQQRKVDVSDFVDGIYIYQIETGDSVLSGKIIVARE